MITFHEALGIVLDSANDWGIESVSLEAALGRFLREDVYADRDFPPFDRVSMDGIALRYAAYAEGRRHFEIRGRQAAGQPPLRLEASEACLEVMTGAVMPEGADTVLRYEDLVIEDIVAICAELPVKRGQNIHIRASDQRAGDLLLGIGTRIRPAEISIAATVGRPQLLVAAQPRLAVVSTGDELVEIHKTPLPHQIRRSNAHTVAALLRERLGVAATLFHFPDDVAALESGIGDILQRFDVVVCSGAVSAGKHDHLPEVLARLGVEKRFHQVAQRPGKPLWFGTKAEKTVFALPGNPVSTFVCTCCYVLPFLERAFTGQQSQSRYAVLAESVTFLPRLTCFLPVAIRFDAQGRVTAIPCKGQGSGDLANLRHADGFLELPAERDHFEAGEVLQLW